MSKKNTPDLSEAFIETCSGITGGVIHIAVFLLITVFPLIYDNSYINILETKYHCYRVCMLGMLGIALLLGLIMMGIDFLEFKGAHTRHFLKKTTSFGSYKPLEAARISLFLFWISAVISTLLSYYPQEAFWGNKGRYSGLFLLTLYVASYFFISRFGRPVQWYLDVFLGSGMVLCLIGITDYFQMDILDLHKAIRASQAQIYISTLGNINTYTAYVAMILGLSATLFALEKRPKKAVWYYCCLVISFMAIIMGCSDNAYLSIATIFTGLPFLLFHNRKGLERYLIILATFFSVIQIIHILNQIFSDIVSGLDSLFLVISRFHSLPALTMLLLVAVNRFYPLSEGSEHSSHCIHYWKILMSMVALIIGFIFLDGNMFHHADRYGSLSTYLVFNDSWGTFRGYIWKRSLQLYAAFPLSQKLFGYGPDTFGLLTNNQIHQEMAQVTRQLFDSAHNSVLQYLLTIGFVGTLAYLTFFISSVICLLKNQNHSACLYGIAFSVLCYALQSLVNIDLPIVTPIMWLLLSIGIAGCRRPHNP